MKVDPDGPQAALLERGSDVNQVENRVLSWSGLVDLTSEALSALQTQLDSPCWQKDVSVCQGLSMT